MADITGLMAKASRAANSAALLLGQGDIDGACNRAYYAMFDAARAALLCAGSEQAGIRTHSGLISAFGLRLVKSGKVERSLGHVLNRAHEIQLVADYTGDMVDHQLAAWTVEQSRTFVQAMQAFIRFHDQPASAPPHPP